jgi:ATP-dependent HslUV protease subunit HslV
MNEERSGGWIRPHATTILGVVRPDGVALAGDGQVTFGEYVIKHRARKIRLLKDGTIIAGFAGAVADALTLIEKFEQQLKAWDGNMRKSAVELAKEWRTDRYLRRLEAQLLIANVDSLLLISGDGDVIEPDDGVAAIGSGAPYASAAARALADHTDLGARELVEAAMKVAAELCIYTNSNFTVEWIARGDASEQESEAEQPSETEENG